MEVDAVCSRDILCLVILHTYFLLQW